mmetsp:Transcript_71585/g.142028  ORF Transcript_71585/g.142028 Transcript_71585/m.142028 type:complete len:582 (+) Transcript_71585:75-1820(+)
MSSGRHTWHIVGFPERVYGFRKGDCLYGPEFKIGKFAFEVHLHPELNDWPEAGALYVRLVSCTDASVTHLKARVSIRLPELNYTGGFTRKDNVAKWKGGFGPKDHVKLGTDIAAFQGQDLTVVVTLEVLEVATPKISLFRIPFQKFEELKHAHNAEACKGGFHMRLTRKFEIHGPKFGAMAFRADVHPNIDATGNMYVSFKLEAADPRVDELDLEYELSLEEVGHTSKPELLRGNRMKWSQALGLAGKPTTCQALQKYSGPMTVRLKVTIVECRFVVERQRPPLWEALVQTDWRYLLISAAGPKVKGVPEPFDGHPPVNGFGNASSLNVARLRGFLLEGGVPSENVLAVNYGEDDEELPHPRELFERAFSELGPATRLVIYFSGHATRDTGAWCMRWRPKGQRFAADVIVEPQELFEWRSACPDSWRVPLQVIVESVAAGAWCVAAKEAQLQGRVITACSAEGVGWAKNDGSLFTDWMIGRNASIPSGHLPGQKQVPCDYIFMGAICDLQLLHPRDDPTVLKSTKRPGGKTAWLGSTQSTMLPSPIDSRLSTASSVSQGIGSLFDVTASITPKSGRGRHPL